MTNNSEESIKITNVGDKLHADIRELHSRQAELVNKQHELEIWKSRHSGEYEDMERDISSIMPKIEHISGLLHNIQLDIQNMSATIKLEEAQKYAAIKLENQASLHKLEMSITKVLITSGAAGSITAAGIQILDKFILS